jgi:hypothetical protein
LTTLRPSRPLTRIARQFGYTKIYVGNMAVETSEEEIRACFESIVPVK